ncbi:hypothetical protein ES703_30016 [subsurface metagenome]
MYPEPHASWGGVHPQHNHPTGLGRVVPCADRHRSLVALRWGVHPEGHRHVGGRGYPGATVHIVTTTEVKCPSAYLARRNPGRVTNEFSIVVAEGIVGYIPCALVKLPVRHHVGVRHICCHTQHQNKTN